MKLQGLSDRGIRRIADMFTDVSYGAGTPRSKIADLENLSPADDELVFLAEVLHECLQDEDGWAKQVSNPRALTRTDNNVEAVKFYMSLAIDEMGRGLNWVGALANIWALHAVTGYTQAIDELHERCCQLEDDLGD